MFTLAQRREIKKIAKSRPAGHGLPFSRWSLAKLGRPTTALAGCGTFTGPGWHIIIPGGGKVES